MPRNNLRHGFTVGKTHPVYNAWVGMRQRCYYRDGRSYKNYGARGIKVCDRWVNSFDNFLEDMFSTWQKGLQLDRKDNDGDYSPDNCRWATHSQNRKNTRRKAIKQSLVDNVTYDARRDKWEVLYRFDTQEEAEKFALNNTFN